ncbi:hypothetical protein [Hyphobacterium sp.]|uniref:hypothetical protein n=1 Tax=Hyphobacterium sp. TaxID=2004662 RepID=UPI003B51B668
MSIHHDEPVKYAGFAGPDKNPGGFHSSAVLPGKLAGSALNPVSLKGRDNSAGITHHARLRD